MLLISDYITSILVGSVAILFFIVFKRKYNYFSDRNIEFVKPKWKEVIRSLSVDYLNDKTMEIYQETRAGDSSYTGFFMAFLKPSILILNPAMAEKVLIKDFSHFHDHGFNIDLDDNPLAGHLFNMKGDDWRTLRHKLVPTFSSGKLKGMVPTMEECAQTLYREMAEDIKLREEVNLKELYKRYSLGVIGSCAFGIDPKSVEDPNSQFRLILNEVVKPSFKAQVRMILLFWLPRVAKLFKIKLMEEKYDEFFLSLTKQTFDMRKKSGVKRNDFIQLLLELKEKGSVEVDAKDLEQDEKETLESLQSQPPPAKLELTDKLLMAQVFVFLVGGYDNSAYLAAIVTYTLSKNPEIQHRVREEIKRCKSKYSGINYQSLREMKLLEACIDESLRLYPPVATLMRECTKAYTLSDGSVIDKGTSILLPALAIHMDSKYWPNPEQFDPDRFLNGQVVAGSYMPFGDGPRICIAQRLALITTKTILAKMLENFELLPSNKTKEPLKLKLLFSVEIEGGIWGNFKPLTN